MKRIILAAAAALTLGTAFGAAEANAQYDRGDDRPRRFERPFERPFEEERFERRRYDADRYDRRPRGYGGERGGAICVTSRGNCRSYPAPYGAPCRCDIPGFGPKRGNIGG